MTEHPIGDEEVFKDLLKTRNIKYTLHFERDRLPYRSNVTKELIEKHLRNPEDLDEFVYERDNHKRQKYQTLFGKSSKYYLKIVLSIANEDLYIVTAHVVNKTKKEKSQMIG